MKKNFAIIGLSMFGTQLAMELQSLGHSVVVIDRDEEKIANIRNEVTEAVIADITVPAVVEELDVNKFDAIVISMPDYFEDAIFALTLLKQQGTQTVMVQAKTVIQKQILYKLGASEVILPDRDMADRLSKKLSMSEITDMFNFKGLAIADLKIQDEYDGKSLRELDLRNRFNVNVLLLRKPGRDPEPVWNPDDPLHKGDELTVIGKEDDIVRAFKD